MPASEREWAQRRQAEELERGRRDRERRGYGPNTYWRDDPERQSAKVAAGRLVLFVFVALWLLGAVLHIAQGAI